MYVHVRVEERDIYINMWERVWVWMKVGVSQKLGIGMVKQAQHHVRWDATIATNTVQQGDIISGAWEGPRATEKTTWVMREIIHVREH